MKRIYCLVTIAVIFLAGCKLGPNYKRPKIDAPTVYRAADQAATQNAASLGDEKWWTVYQDPELQQLIRTALAENYDVKIAAARVLQAQAVLGITRADQFPTVDAGASGLNQRIPNTAAGPETNTGAMAVNHEASQRPRHSAKVAPSDMPVTRMRDLSILIRAHTSSICLLRGIASSSILVMDQVVPMEVGERRAKPLLLASRSQVQRKSRPCP